MVADSMATEYPVVHTFIQYPSLRSPSLEQFVEEREVHSCPASRMLSLEEDPFEEGLSEQVPPDDEEAVTLWPATRGPSMEEDPESALASGEDAFIQWPATRGPSLEEDPIEMLTTPVENFFAVQDASTQWPVPWGSFLPENSMMPAWPSMQGAYSEEFTEAQCCPTFQNLAVWDVLVATSPEENLRSESHQWSATQDSSLEELLKAKSNSNSAVKDPAACDASTAASSVEEDLVRELLLPSGLHDAESDKDAPREPALAISLTACLGIWSAGSSSHAAGTCTPCGFLWKDTGCQKGQNCGFCHLCPAGEVKRRKKEKLLSRKMEQSFQNDGATGKCS